MYLLPNDNVCRIFFRSGPLPLAMFTATHLRCTTICTSSHLMNDACLGAILCSHHRHQQQPDTDSFHCIGWRCQAADRRRLRLVSVVSTTQHGVKHSSANIIKIRPCFTMTVTTADGPRPAWTSPWPSRFSRRP